MFSSVNDVKNHEDKKHELGGYLNENGQLKIFFFIFPGTNIHIGG